jgi:hypothetical protein
MNSGGIFDLPTKRKELTELEKEAMATDFWGNTQRPKSEPANFFTQRWNF